MRGRVAPCSACRVTQLTAAPRTTDHTATRDRTRQHDSLWPPHSVVQRLPIVPCTRPIRCDFTHGSTGPRHRPRSTCDTAAAWHAPSLRFARDWLSAGLVRIAQWATGTSPNTATLARAPQAHSEGPGPTSTSAVRVYVCTMGPQLSQPQMVLAPPLVRWCEAAGVSTAPGQSPRQPR